MKAKFATGAVLAALSLNEVAYGGNKSGIKQKEHVGAPLAGDDTISTLVNNVVLVLK